ncbi:hypothetical protein ACFLZB_03530 [Nanoarchaeota archaeon]
MATSKKFKAIIILLVIISLVYGSVSIVYNNLIIVDVVHRPMAASVTYGNDILIYNYVNVTPLLIGKTNPSTTIKGFQIANNNFSFPIEIELETSGELAQFVTIEPTKFILAPGEDKKYVVSFRPAFGAETGRLYEGFLKVTKKRVLG